MAEAKKPGPKKGIMLSNQHREKIQKSQILQSLIEHAEGKREMSSTQVTAGLGLLKKCLPDLQSIQMDATHTHDVSDPLKELIERIGTSGKKVHSD